VDTGSGNSEVPRAFLRDSTAFVFVNSNQHPIKITGQKGYASTQLFKSKQLNFEQLGIGGLDKQFEAIFRRAFASRVFPPSIVQRLGINHVRGLLLFGPPGAPPAPLAAGCRKRLRLRAPAAGLPPGPPPKQPRAQARALA
jgi:vesicle-fusing ATPase